jgi:putative membrane protein insertion efficiency factor
MRALNWLAILAIRVYQRTLSPALGRRGMCCLHHPSCSEYGVLAYRKYGFVRATLLTWSRYRDCHPFSGRPYVDFP